MDSAQIARAIANVTIFLEFVTDEVLEDDIAIQVLEQLSGDLTELDDHSRHELATAFRSIASEYDGEVREFVEGLPETFGIEDKG